MAISIAVIDRDRDQPVRGKSAPSRPVADNDSDHVIRVERPAELAGIASPGINFAWLDRTVPDSLRDFCDALDPSVIEPQDRILAGHQARDAISRLVAATWPEPTLGRQHLMSDLVVLTDVFARITGARRIRLRIAPGPSDAGETEFATAHDDLTLVTAYLGAGPQWLPNHAVERDDLEEEPVRFFGLDENAARQLPRFAVGLFKGEAWPGNKGNGIVRRTPPDANTPQIRVSLTRAG